jgi:type IV pilus assembly protein PilY1
MRHLTRSLACAAVAAAAAVPLAPPAAALNLGTEPLYLGASIPPIVMLIAPKDHQLFKKAYDDFSDLDSSLPGGDATLEITYKHSIDYYGYFDPFKCYDYVNAGTANARFIPAATTVDKRCTGKWAGNFLNWASMSRLDVMRKLLYGGFRLVDAASGTPLTVLARAPIPVEGHAWAKHYRGEGGATIAEVTPFSTALTAPRTYAITGQSKTITGTAGTLMSFTSINNPSTAVHPLVNGDQVTICRTGSTVNCMFARVTTEAFGASVTITFTIDGRVTGATGTHTSWTITNHSSQGITICNTTQDTANASHTTSNLPLMRVAAGDYTLWAVGERQVCRWSDEPPAALNANQMFQSELEANSGGPRRGGTAPTTLNAFSVTNGDYVVHVLACDPARIGTERCTQYPNGNIKPTGLLHDYAASTNKKIKFGLLTGSYAKNKSGGVLRRSAGFLDSSTSAAPSSFDSAVDEINADTGVFNTGVRGIISTFNRIKLYGFDYTDGLFDSNDNCGNPAVVNFTDGNCSSWGNPLAEMYVEALRYFAGRSPSGAFTYTEGAGQKDFDLGLRQGTWASPIGSSNYCTPLNLIVMNASVNSYDRDQVPTDLFPAGTTAITLTNTVGAHEGINGGSFLVGRASGTPATSDICTPKTIANFGNASGVCPEAPALGGSYLIAGAAHWARTNRIRTDLTVPATDARALKVNTYGIALASGAPKIEIPVPGSSPTRFVTILPASQSWNSGDGAGNSRGGGAIVDFKVIRQDHAAGTGKFFVSWENAQQGSDYDLDVWGTIEYRFQASNTQIVVTTNTFFGAAGTSTLFGYVISGTAGQDGVHFHSGFKGTSNTVISYHYPTGYNTNTTGNNECNDCRHTDPPASRTYTVSASPAATVLRDPLYYATKYGGFTDQNANGRPDLAQEWDSRNNLTGADGTDGNPDTYFPVTNPGALESALDRAFISVLQVSSASSVATNSTSLQSGSIVYQARFNANEWSGQLLAFSISTTGAIDPTPQWDAGQLIPAANSRTIITYRPDAADQARGDTPKGVPFRFDSLNTLQQADLNKNAIGTPDAAGVDCTGVTSTSFTPAGCTKQGRLRLNWLRGDQANEGATATKYRVRPTTRLGDIVNSTPIYVGPPTPAQYGDFAPPAAAYTSDPTYETYRTAAGVVDRTPIIYAGGNDGMLHGFDAGTGAQKGVEKIAYVPSTTYRNLTRLTDKTYSHRYFVDGSPTVADVKFDDGSWHTILVGGLNAGGQGVYALDITNPNNFAESRANDVVLWEWTDFNDDRLGNTYSQPSIAKMRNGKFAVIFGNGYNNSIAAPPADSGATVSLSGCASLHILFVEGGKDGLWGAADFVTIDVPVECSATNPNGLATPRVVDVDNDGIADYIYAGDLRGNMWKFDVRNPAPAVWALANAATPLFIATDAIGNRQPITAAATTFPNPHQAGTTMILFGTGKYLEQIDNDPPHQYQSFYGLWDKHDGSTITGRSQLLEQKVLGASVSNPLGVTADNVATTGVDESGFRITTPYQPNYTGGLRVNTQFGETNPLAVDETVTTPAQRGWYMDFPFSGDPAVGTGERVVFRPVISTGKLVFTTLVPSAANCEFGGTSFLMDLDPVTGARLGVSPFDVNNDTDFNSADLISTPWGNVTVSGMQSRIGIVPTPTVIAMPPNEIKVLSGSSGALITVRERGAPPLLPGAAGRRILWRQLFTD